MDAASGGAPVPLDMRKTFALHIYGVLAVGYAPDSPREGPLTILRSRKSDSAVELWEQYVNGPVKIVEIEGAHTEFGREPVVGEVGRCLAVAIRSAFSES